MSIWTHVAAIIRIDAIKGFAGPQTKKDIEDILGPMALWDGKDEDWDACSLPCGSEGSLQYQIWENEDKCSASAYTVSVFGDLRDYNETGSIQKWFNDFCDSFLMIRQAVCLAETEGCQPRVFQYERKV